MMTFPEFVRRYDVEHAVVLLEGKRKVRAEDRDKLSALGRLLASGTRHMIFRSGNAEGADQWFAEGVAAVDHRRMQVITPYAGHRQRSNHAYDTIALDTLDIASEPEILLHSKSHKQTEKLIDPFAAGERNRNTIKAAYIIRDTVKVLGTADIRPATFGIFYDDPAHPRTGGTGHTMQVCASHDIPLIDQGTWFHWLDA